MKIYRNIWTNQLYTEAELAKRFSIYNYSQKTYDSILAKYYQEL